APRGSIADWIDNSRKSTRDLVVYPGAGMAPRPIRRSPAKSSGSGGSTNPHFLRRLHRGVRRLQRQQT
ncbi:hypothetical protein, partial [Mesorhizobium sp. M7A.T.Ca.US.000.02.2.1]|uniref:hypothetical protein n=1 Tax=Mesorhizobium sp. M7A.T.Ca.US.000.02.2.1 TaxID=2496793 RepID=UPI001AEC9AF0